MVLSSSNDAFVIACRCSVSGCRPGLGDSLCGYSSSIPLTSERSAALRTVIGTRLDDASAADTIVESA